MLNQAQELIFERYRHPLFAGAVTGRTHAADGANPVCGDELRIELRLTNGIVEEIRHATRACAVCTAAADLLAETMQGRPVTEVNDRNMPALVGIPLSPVRLKCALLPLETLKRALTG